jgi:nitroreductase
MERRQFLKIAGAAGVVAAGGGIWMSHEGGELTVEKRDAYAAWATWTHDGEPRPVKLVRAAILASSPHNTQPWRFRVGESFVEIYLDTRRKVGGLDPFLREAHIGMGCALENLLLAAQANGYAAEVTMVEGALEGMSEEPRLRLMARVDLKPGVRQASELYEAVPRRHTNRSVYDPAKALPDGFAAQLQAICNVGTDARLFLIGDSAQRAALTQTSAAANLELYSDDEVENGSDAWIRWRSQDIAKHKDGLTIDAFGLSPWMTSVAHASPVWTLKRAAAPSSRGKMYQSQMESAPMIAVIGVRDRLETKSCLLAGQIWQRAHLLATARGIAMRPCNEAIEMIDRERKLGRPAARLEAVSRVLGDTQYQPTFLFLIGYPTRAAGVSPRRPVEEVAVLDKE